MDCEMKTTMWFQPGWCRNDTAVVLDCPGKEEMLANRPAVGETGKNLCILLCELRKANIKDLCKRTIEIINASRIPHYKGALDGATTKDYEVEINIEFAKSRLMRNEITHILCFGKYAEMLFDKMQKEMIGKTVFCCPHIGRQGLADGKRLYRWTDDYHKLGVCRGRLQEVSEFVKRYWHAEGIHRFPRNEDKAIK